MSGMLTGQRVLYVAPRFFGYEVAIRQELERRGAQVDWLPDRPFDTPLQKAVTRLGRSTVLPLANRLYRKMLSQWDARHYDWVFVVNGQTLSLEMLREIRRSFPMARTVLYAWDSIENRRGIVDNLGEFDATFSFDPQCAKHFGMQLRPLFFSPGFSRPVTPDFDHHLSFIGTAHSDRYAVVSRLRDTLTADIQAYWYLYLQAPWVYHAYKLAKPAMRRASIAEFHFVPLDKATVQEVFGRSRAIVDIEHPLQRGLTMRTLETVGARKKLVTTNRHVENYDFYRPGNVCIIDRRAPAIPPSFLHSPYEELAPDVYQRYSIAGWMDELLSTDRSQHTPAPPSR
ncbi:hypothetical protein LRS03_23730 [Rhizobacter sp. J219]|uniref:hypothetical protein n=1 Tax=Rhizobacter sp. J219 TaxID=2898430 RepID=UPI00215095D6|nr:hypothetical protein [Rhizobacter sp. J219]MCR5885704.1 hypothetical protein [Rhizobacter sp. J219]